VAVADFNGDGRADLAVSHYDGVSVLLGKPALARAGLPSVGLYTLRHTCATLLPLADQPAKVVSERLGHSSITLTLDTYSHVLPTMQKRAAGVMGATLGAARRAGKARKAE
jgi:integrase